LPATKSRTASGQPTLAISRPSKKFRTNKENASLWPTSNKDEPELGLPQVVDEKLTRLQRGAISTKWEPQNINGWLAPTWRNKSPLDVMEVLVFHMKKSSVFKLDLELLYQRKRIPKWMMSAKIFKCSMYMFLECLWQSKPSLIIWNVSEQVWYGNSNLVEVVKLTRERANETNQAKNRVTINDPIERETRDYYVPATKNPFTALAYGKAKSGKLIVCFTNSTWSAEVKQMSLCQILASPFRRYLLSAWADSESTQRVKNKKTIAPIEVDSCDNRQEELENCAPFASPDEDECSYEYDNLTVQEQPDIDNLFTQGNSYENSDGEISIENDDLKYNSDEHNDLNDNEIEIIDTNTKKAWNSPLKTPLATPTPSTLHKTTITSSSTLFSKPLIQSELSSIFLSTPESTIVPTPNILPQDSPKVILSMPSSHSELPSKNSLLPVTNSNIIANYAKLNKELAQRADMAQQVYRQGENSIPPQLSNQALMGLSVVQPLASFKNIAPQTFYRSKGPIKKLAFDPIQVTKANIKQEYQKEQKSSNCSTPELNNKAGMFYSFYT